MVSTSRILVGIVQICYEAKDWDALNENIMLLSKRRSQLKQVGLLPVIKVKMPNKNVFRPTVPACQSKHVFLCLYIYIIYIIICVDALSLISQNKIYGYNILIIFHCRLLQRWYRNVIHMWML